MVAPILDEIASERPDIKVGKINVDEQPELSKEFGVMSIILGILSVIGAMVKVKESKIRDT